MPGGAPLKLKASHDRVVPTLKPRSDHKSFFGSLAHAVHTADSYVGRQAKHQWSEFKRTEHQANQRMSAELKNADHHAQDQGRSGNVWKDWGTAFAHAGKKAYRAVDRPLTHAEKTAGKWLWNGPLDLKGTYTAGGSHGKPVWQQPESGHAFKAPRPGVIEELLSPVTQLVKKPSATNAALAMAMIMPGPKPLRGEGMALTRAEMKSRPWFRGDAANWKHDQIDPAKFDSHALFGPGLYLTDNPHVASSYVDKGSEYMGGREVITANIPPPGGADLMHLNPRMPNKEWRRKIAELNVPKKRERRDLLRQRLEEAAAYHRNEGHDVGNVRRWPPEGSAISREDQQQIYPGMREVAFDWSKPEAGANVKAFALPGVTNTLHENTPPTRAQLKSLTQAASTEDVMRRLLTTHNEYARNSMQPDKTSMSQLHSNSADLWAWLENWDNQPSKGGKFLWGGLKNQLGFDAVQVNELLRSAGIQGMQYHGGQRYGGGGPGGSHTAINLFDPKFAVPHAGMGGTPKTGIRGERALKEYNRRLKEQAPKVSKAGREQGSQIQGDYDLDSLYQLGKVYAKDAKITNPSLQEDYLAAFIYAYQSKHPRPFGLSQP